MPFFRTRLGTVRLHRSCLAAVVGVVAVFATGASPGAASTVTVNRSCAPSQAVAPGVVFRHCTARLSNLRSTQQVYMVMWKQGDRRISLAAQPLGAPAVST